MKGDLLSDDSDGKLWPDQVVTLDGGKNIKWENNRLVYFLGYGLDNLLGESTGLRWRADEDVRLYFAQCEESRYLSFLF